MGLEVLPASADSEWMDVLSETVQHDFHHLASYHRLAEYRGEGAGRLFCYREAGHLIALPLLLRAVDGDAPDGWRDATSVYGYGGPVASGASIPQSIVQNFQKALAAELAAQRVVAVFSRLHPLISQERILSGLGQISPVGLTISVDLTIPLDQQWAGYSKKCRRVIEKARDAGVVVVHDHDWRYQGEWIDIYDDTMRRVNASTSYYLEAAYFDQLARELKDVVQLFVALVDGTVAAGGLYTICDGIVQAHLGGMRREYMKISPTRLVDDTARVWAFESGARVFHLGGGVGGREDSLFQYKSGFSDRRHQFSTWRWIVDADVYKLLCEGLRVDDVDEITDNLGSQYFPAYRDALRSRGANRPG
jgi:hypothetical protein